MHNKSAQFIQNYNSYTMSKVWFHSYKNQTTFPMDGPLFSRPSIRTELTSIQYTVTAGLACQQFFRLRTVGGSLIRP